MAARWQWLWGRHAVEEALKAGERKVRELWVLHESRGPHVAELVKIARGMNARVRWVPRRELDRIAGGAEHQGLALMTLEKGMEDFPTFLSGLAQADRKSLVLVALDQIQDPQNLGAIARSAACLGARALLVPDRRAAPVTQAAVQASAGALEKIPVYDVGNIAQALTRLKELGYWVYGADMAGKPAWEVTFNAPMVLVVGSEGTGIRRLVLDRCDEVVSIPQSEKGVASLNASCAASILLYEAARQLRAAGALSSSPSRAGQSP